MHNLSKVLAVGLIMLAMSVTSALAHSTLLTSVPANNDVLGAPPAEVRMDFNEPVGILSFVLLEPNGNKLDLTSLTRGGQTVVVPLPSALPPGTEALTWHIISADGHPVGGALIFSIGRITETVGQVRTDIPLGIAIWLTRVMVYVGFFIGAGGMVFGAIVALPDLAKRTSFATMALGAVAAIVSIGLQGADGLSTGLAGLLDPHVWQTGVTTTFTLTVMLALVAFGLAALSSLVEGADRALAAILTLACVGGALAASGHASAADPQWLTRPAVFLHVSAVCFWIGSLLPLGVLLMHHTPEAEVARRRFSEIIPFALLPLLFAGLVLAYVQLGRPGEAWLTPYAAILGSKLLLVLSLFALAAWNRWRLSGPALTQDAARRRMIISIRAEIGLVIIVLGLVAGWRFTVPPRAIAEELSIPAQAQLVSSDLMATVEILPGRVGDTNVTVSLMDAERATVTPLSVKLEFEQKTAGVGPIEVDASKTADGSWRASHVVLPTSGTWSISVEARTGTFEMETLTGAIEVQ